MTQLIKLNAKAASKLQSDGISETKAKIVTALTKLGATKEGVDLADVKKACKSVDAKVLRQHMRDLAEDKIVSVRKVAAVKAAA